MEIPLALFVISAILTSLFSGSGSSGKDDDDDDDVIEIKVKVPRRR